MRLSSLGHNVIGYDIRKDAADELANNPTLRFTAAAEASDLSRNVDSVFVSLPTSNDVNTAIFGQDGLAKAGTLPTAVIDLTSGDPFVSQKLHAALAERGTAYIDAGVSGGVLAAARGTLSMMVGATPEDFERLKPVLQMCSDKIYYIGSPGTGHAAKAINNLLAAAHRLVFCEAMVLGAKMNLPLVNVVDVVSKSTGRDYTSETFFDKVLSGRKQLGFTLGLMLKDVDTALGMAAQVDVSMPASRMVGEIYRLIVHQLGTNADLSEVLNFMEQLSDVRVE